MGRSIIARTIYITFLLLVLVACSNGGEGTSSPANVQPTATPSRINIGSITVGYPGAIDGGTVTLQPATSFKQGTMIAIAGDSGLIYSPSLQYAPRSATLLEWYPDTNTSVTIVPALPGKLPRQPLVAANAQWVAVVYEPVSNDGPGNAGLVGSGWELRIINRMTNVTYTLAQDTVSGSITETWNTFVTPDFSLYGDTLLWSDFVVQSGSIHHSLHLTNLATRATSEILNIDADGARHLIFLPNLSDNYAAWTESLSYSTDPNHPDEHRTITVYDLRQGTILRKIDLGHNTHFGIAGPVIIGDLLAFGLNGLDSKGSTTSAVGYTSVKGSEAFIVTNEVGQPSLVTASADIITWDIHQSGKPIAYNVLTHQSYLVTAKVDSIINTTVSNHRLFWQINGEPNIYYQDIH